MDNLIRPRRAWLADMRTIRSSAALLFAALCATLAGPPAFAIPAAVQDFEGGTTAGWVSGGGGGFGPVVGSPVVVGNGRNGANDHYLQVTSLGGTGPGSRLTTINRSEWDGDFTAAGLTNVTMDLRNFGNSDVNVRLVLLDLSDLNDPNYASTAAALLPAGSDWTNVTFSLAVPGLAGVFGSAADLLHSVTELRIMGFPNGSATFTLPPDNLAMTAQLGVDNLRPNVFGTGGGNQVPEPATASLFLLGLLAAARAVRSRRR